MNERQIPILHEGLDAYAGKLERRLRRMRLEGHVSRAYADLDLEIAERRRILRNRVSTAIRGGRFWDIVKAELARDYVSLFDNALGYGRRVDTEYEAGCGRRTLSGADARTNSSKPAGGP